MIKKLLAILLMAIMSLTLFVACTDAGEGDPDKDKDPDKGIEETVDYAKFAAENKERAITYATAIKEKYWSSESLSSFLIPGEGTPYLWPYTEQVSMANSLLTLLDEDAEAENYKLIKDYLIELLEGLRYYRVSKAGEGYTNTDFGVLNAELSSYACYNSGRNGSAMDSAGTDKNGIYFDDNIWVVKEFYNAYLNLGEEKYLNEAINITNWIIGEGMETAKCSKTDTSMYGIYWKWGVKDTHSGTTNDNTNASLNTCSSAPTAMMLVKLHNVMKDAKFNDLKASYLLSAKRIYNFVYNVLRDEQSNTFKDKIFIYKDSAGKLYLGTVDEQILPYNTGCMMTAGAELYRDAAANNQQANAKSYLERNKLVAAGADKKFANTLAVEGQYSYNKNSWFTSFLIEGFADLADFDENAETYIDHMRSALDYGWKNNRAADGLVCPAWVEGWSVYTDDGVSEGNPRQILLQSANAHCYSMLAAYYSKLAAKQS